MAAPLSGFECGEHENRESHITASLQKSMLKEYNRPLLDVVGLVPGGAHRSSEAHPYCCMQRVRQALS
eukprot:6457048-Amphidinium_carterae.1